MKSQVRESPPRGHRTQLSRVLQETLLDTVAAGLTRPIDQDPPDISHPRSHQDHFSKSTNLTDHTISEKGSKRKLDTTDNTPFPSKRARLTQTDLQQPTEVQTDEIPLQQPKPKSFQPASILQDFVEPLGPGPASFHGNILEWLSSVGSDRKRHCRSDTHLRQLGESRRLTTSAPDMSGSRHCDMMPPATSSLVSRSFPWTETSATGTASVRHRSYRRGNLALNGIHVRNDHTQLPEYVLSHIEAMRAERDSPGPAPEELKQYIYELSTLADGCNDADVERFFEDTVFPKASDETYGRSTGLASAMSTLMSSCLVPNNPESPFQVSLPKPDLLYGYSGEQRDGAFSSQQLLAQTSLHPHNARFAEATTDGLRFPFLAIEFKAAGGTRGDLWVATNQCAGALSACLNVVDQLNTLLSNHPSVQRVDNLSYAISLDNNIAQLHVSWKEEGLNYYLQRVDAFLLSDPAQFKRVRTQVRNILDWGKNKRLKQIRDASDTILEENRKAAAEHAKSRQPSSDEPAHSSSKKRKSASSRKS